MNTINKKEMLQKTVFSPSVNIIRDVDTPLNYIPTPNTRQVYNQIINDYKIGVRSFCLVGAYGTGKSSFLWALTQEINQERDYFSSSTNFPNIKGFRTLPFIGEYSSIIEAFAKNLRVNGGDFSSKIIIKELDNLYQGLRKESLGLLILVDEFGKFLEFAAKNNPEEELYFIQQIAEYVNDSKKEIFFISTLHQDFNGYARELSKLQQNEWDKVKGRLKDVTFNEPIEQLLFLAAERLSKSGEVDNPKLFKELFDSIEAAKAFPLKDYFNVQFAKKLLPFDILSASVMTLALQKYGQNERSLFSFIESNDPLGIKDFNKAKAPFYHLGHVYDYLIHNFYSFLSTKYNPHYTQWAAIRNALDRVEGLFEGDYEEAGNFIKAIGLLNIFATASARINAQFLESYAKYSQGIKDGERILKSLEGLRIIRYVKHSNKFILFEGTDLDIELAIDEAGNLVERVTNVVHHLIDYFEFPYISAKAIYYQKGTPRIFSFFLSESPTVLVPENEIDGYINLVFSEELIEEELKEISQNCKEAILFGWYKNSEEIRSLIFEIEKVKKVKEQNLEDRVALRELENILQHQINLLNHYVLGNIYSEESTIRWYFQGKELKVTDEKSFNRILSEICNVVYPYTPVFRNEMVNKTKVSGPIITARKSLIKSLIENWAEENLGFEEAKFPPEKTIYLSLLKETGIHRNTENGLTLGMPINIESQLQPLWDECEGFLEITKLGKRNLSELIQTLLARPFKLKKGFIDFWLPIFLFTKKDEFALFGKDGYIPYLSEETLDLVCREPKNYEVKAFDVNGVKLDLFNSYRALLNQKSESEPSNRSFIETIRPFLIFYKDLPQYAKKTKRLKKRTILLREAIANAKEPEETFFEHFPKALGFSLGKLRSSKDDLENYIYSLETNIREIRACFEELVNRFELFLKKEILSVDLSFPDYKIALQKRFKEIRTSFLLPHQRVFHQRVFSELDDRKSWLNSISQAVIGKSLDIIGDDDEKLLYEKLKDIIHELDNLCEVSKVFVDQEKEIIYKIEITSLEQGVNQNFVRLPKSKELEISRLQKFIKSNLSLDKQLNIAILVKTLEEILRNE